MKEKNIQQDNDSVEPENVFVWLDFDAYSYVNFGIITELAKLNKFNFIGIVASKHDLTFFETQKIVPFKKLIYFPECYLNKSSYNIENLRLLERKYELNLWSDIFSERYFYKYWKDFHKFPDHEILTITENILKFFDDIIEKYKPRFILMQQAGENISNLLLYKIAKKMHIKILMPSLVHMKNKIAISDNLTINEISNEFKQRIQNYSNSDQIYDKKFIREKNSGELKTVFKYTYKINFNQKIKHYVKRIFNDPEYVYQNFGKTKYNMIKDRFKKKIRIKKVDKFFEQNSIKSIQDKKFFYFPLASEPEARILASAPFYSNQITLIENIAKGIPIDSILYVKEHPIQKIKYWRSIEDYQKIISIPNVKLVHPNVESEDFLLECQGVITISGGTGFEALFYKKPVFLFADEFYDVLSMVTKIHYISKLPKYINDGLNNFEFKNNEFNAFMESFDKHTISIPYHMLIKEGNEISSIQEYDDNFNITINLFQKFFQKHKAYFELMAKTIYSKI